MHRAMRAVAAQGRVNESRTVAGSVGAVAVMAAGVAVMAAPATAVVAAVVAVVAAAVAVRVATAEVAAVRRYIRTRHAVEDTRDGPGDPCPGATACD